MTTANWIKKETRLRTRVDELTEKLYATGPLPELHAKTKCQLKRAQRAWLSHLKVTHSVDGVAA